MLTFFDAALELTRAPINRIGRRHIIAFLADDILMAAIFLRSINSREAAAQVKWPLPTANQAPDRSWLAVLGKA
jgi:hypothetical protein